MDRRQRRLGDFNRCGQRLSQALRQSGFEIPKPIVIPIPNCDGMGEIADIDLDADLDLDLDPDLNRSLQGRQLRLFRSQSCWPIQRVQVQVQVFEE